MGEPYVLKHRPIVLQQLEAIYDEIASDSDRQALRDLVKRAESALRSRPHEFGDPYFTTKEENGAVFHRILPPLSLYYVIFEEHHTVFIIKVRRID